MSGMRQMWISDNTSSDEVFWEEVMQRTGEKDSEDEGERAEVDTRAGYLERDSGSDG